MIHVNLMISDSIQEKNNVPRYLPLYSKPFISNIVNIFSRIPQNVVTSAKHVFKR